MMRGVIAANKVAQAVTNLPIPEPGQNQVLVKVLATALNRADTLQRRGAYPPPPGVTEVMGLEIAGKVHKVGPGANVAVGTAVMALVSGGAFAEYCVADQGSLIPIPTGLSMKEAGCIPEVFLTAFQLLAHVGKVKPTDTVLIHAAASGVGTAAIQLAKLLGVQNIIATTSEGKLGVCKSLGATHVLDRKANWDEELLKVSKPVDLVLDCIGASYAEKNLKVLGMDSRWVLYGLMGGAATPEGLFAQILRKRISLLGSTLRARSDGYKAELVADFIKSGALSALGDGRIKPILDEKSFEGLESIDEALNYMEKNTSIGKIPVQVSTL